jgi:site-specific DNA-methyltransferase (adenine-specific)/modification methylase
MRSLPTGCADVIFADPPYNLQLKGDLLRPDSSMVDAVNDEWDQFESMTAYVEFSRKWLSEAMRLLTRKGTIWVIGSYHNIFNVGHVMRELGFWFLNDVVWSKTNPMPNFNGTRFTNATETMIWAKASEKQKQYTFNYQEMKIYNDDKQMTNVWEIPICTGSERIKVNGKKVHSTQKPEALLERVILSSSNRGDLILDPFSGSGTTAAVAHRLGRRFIGIERDPSYVAIARARIMAIEPSLFLEPMRQITDRKLRPKVPFGQLVSAGLIAVGSTIFGKQAGVEAIVLQGGKIRSQNHEGSIHRLAALLEEREAANGWDYWFTDFGRTVSINDIRESYLTENWLNKVDN